MSVLERLVVRFDVDPSGVTRGMQQAARTIETGNARVIRSMDAAALNTNKLGNAFGDLAQRTLGIPPTISRLADVLGDFAVGGAVTAGVLGGLALMGVAWQNLTENTRKAREETDRAITSLANAARSRAAASIPGLEKQVTQRRADLDARLAERTRAQLTDITFRSPAEWMTFGIDTHSDKRKQAEDLAVEATMALGEAQRLLSAAITERSTIEGVASKSAEDVAREGKKLADAEAERAARLSRILSMAIPERVGIAEARAAAEGRGAASEAGRNFRNRIAATVEGIPTKPTPGTGTPAADIIPFSRFREAVEAFKGGVAQMLKGTLSTGGLANIGANLAGSAIGFVAEKLTGAVGKFLAGTDRMAEALERNARALSASGDAIKGRLKSANLTETADSVALALEKTRDRWAFNELKPLPTRGGDRLKLTLEEELGRAGIDWTKLSKVAELLGISIPDKELLSIDLVSQFLEQIQRATEGVESFANALRNVPEGFKVDLARFNATMPGVGAAMPRAGAGAGVTINGKVTVVANNPEEFAREVTRLAARGRGSPFLPAYAR